MTLRHLGILAHLMERSGIDRATLQRADEAKEGELASCVVSRAKRDYSQWWAAIDAKREGR